MNSKRRFVALGLVASATMLNYLDRAIIGVAAPAMSQDLQLDPMQMGWIFSAFTWSYVLAQLPCGALLDHMGSRRTYCLSITAWSAFMGCQALCMNFYSAFAMRLGLGAAEAPCFPGASRIVAAWFPQSERARATSIYTVGEYIGIAALSPLLYWMMPLFGWRMLFVVMGFVGFVFAAFWWKIYRDPHEDLFVSQDELNLIKAGGALVHQSARPNYDWATIRRLLSFRQIWGAGIGSFAGNATLVFFCGGKANAPVSSARMALVRRSAAASTRASEAAQRRHHHSGRPIGSFTQRQLAQAVAYAPQSHTPAFPYLVKDVVQLGGLAQSPFGLRKADDETGFVVTALESLAIAHLAERPYTELSGGERQAVLLARALAQKARILILDEPETGLDYGQQKRFLNLPRRLASEGYCILTTTHDPLRARDTFDRALCVD